MKYTVYAVDGNSTAIITAEAEAVEIGCDNCGARWIHEALRGWLHPCPYCGADDMNFGSDELAEQSASAEAYGRELRGVARQFWGGSIDYDQAFFYFIETIRLGLTRAWHEGARDCGIAPSELTPEETAALDGAIFNETSRLGGLVQFIDDNSKDNGGKLATVLARVESWGLRYADVVNRARLMACADQKLQWTINATRMVKDNCSSCLRLNGKVKRASYWAKSGIHPQNPPNPRLECGGWLCGCALLPTNDPLSRGPLPNVP